MKKCPRCGYDMKDNEKFCPHCGLDLQQHYGPRGPKNKSMTYLLYVIIFFSFATIPLLYSRLLNNTNFGNISSSQKEKSQLEEVVDVPPKAIVASLTTLADFNNQFTNVSTYVENIEKYEAELSSKGDYTFDKSYKIQVLDNYNVMYECVYTTKISDNFSLMIEKKFDRAHSYNKETVSFKKNNVTVFKDFMFNEEELAITVPFVDDQEMVKKLMNEFSSREEEVEKKREKLGHYGIGNYDGESSFLVHRVEKSYYSMLTYVSTPKHYIDK